MMRAHRFQTSAALLFATLGIPGLTSGQQVAEVQVAPVTVTLAVGERRELLASAYDARGDNVATARFVWVSNPTGIVRVEEDPGLPGIAVLVGVAPGIANVEARVGNRRAQAAVQVVGVGGAPAAGAGTGVATVLQIEPGTIFLLPTEEVRPQPRFLNDNGDLAAPMAVGWRFLGQAGVAEISAQGAILGLGPGQGVLEATTQTGLVSRVMVDVSQVPFAFSTAQLGLSPGVSDTINVTVPDQNNRLLANNGLVWRSTNVSIARVTPLGVAIGVAPGSAEIIATGYGQESRLPVMVHRPVEYLEVTPLQSEGTVAVPLGGTRVFEATALAADETPVPEAPLTWILADTTVGTFDQETRSLTGNVLGRTSLTVRAPGEGLAVVWDVEVVVGGLQLDPDVVALSRGVSHQLQPFFTDDAGEAVAPAPPANIIWSSSDTAVAQVDADGNVNPVGFGSARVVANTPWGSVDTAAVFVNGDILVTSTRGGTADIHTLDVANPGEIHQVTDQPGSETAAVYSPDATKIAFVSDLGGNLDIFVADADGGNLVQLTTTLALNGSPSWTPDGSRIVYESDESGTSQIWIMNADGTDPVQLTRGEAPSYRPSVSPNGARMLFSSSPDGNYDIFLMNIDGTQQENLTQSRGNETVPVWLTDSTIAFIQEQGRGRDLTRSVVQMALNVNRDITELGAQGLMVTDFSISAAGDILAATVSAQGAQGMESRLYIIPLTPDGVPAEVPRADATDQLVSPSFRRR